jgi:hypothetical protein
LELFSFFPQTGFDLLHSPSFCQGQCDGTALVLEMDGHLRTSMWLQLPPTEPVSFMERGQSWSLLKAEENEPRGFSVFDHRGWGCSLALEPA